MTWDLENNASLGIIGFRPDQDVDNVGKLGVADVVALAAAAAAVAAHCCAAVVVVVVVVAAARLPSEIPPPVGNQSIKSHKVI